MAITKPIQIKRGQEANLSTLSLLPGELAVTLDTGKLYVGNGTGKVLINTDKEALREEDIPDLSASKITDLGTAATRDVGTEPGNIPVLDINGKLDVSLIPSISMGTTFPNLTSEEEMLALNANVGDVAIRSDTNATYRLIAEPASEIENWKELLTPTGAVASVNGKTGNVTLTALDVNLENVTNESKETMFHNAVFTGTTLGTTVDTEDDSTQFATTAFVKAQNYLSEDSFDVIDGGTF